MKTVLECLPCLTKNAWVIALRSCDDPALQHRIISESMHRLAETGLEQPPPYYAREIMDIALRHCNCPQADPYKQEKEKSTVLARRLLAGLDSIPEYDPGSFESRLRLAIAGNILDFGIFADLNLEEALKTIRQAFTNPIDLGAMRKLEKRIESAGKILYVLDNCGEAVFDRIFMELFQDKVTVAVRGRNSLNDVTRRELTVSGYDSALPVVDNGSGIPGTMEEHVPDDFRQAMQSADLIIAKGQGNFETMNEMSYPISFLFLAKCPVVIQLLGTEPKSIQIRNINF